MKNLFKIALLILLSAYLVGCKNIHVGGNAQAGTVSGSGQVTVSIPQEQ